MNASSPQEVSEQVKPFAAVLQEARGGGLHTELSEGLAEVVAAVQEHGKVGELTLRLKVHPSGDGQTVFVTDYITSKAPEGERPKSLFYADSGGNLSRRDPRQPALPVRDAARAAEGGAR